MKTGWSQLMQAGGVLCLVAIMMAGSRGTVYAGLLSSPTTVHYIDTDCHALKLVDARGVPVSPIHKYEFRGTCNLNKVFPTGPSVIRSFPAEGRAEWNAVSRELKESFTIIGSFPYEGQLIGGEVRSEFKCNDDPVVVKGVSCTRVGHVNTTNLAPLSNPYKQSRPLLKGKTTLAEASALSMGQSGMAGVTYVNPKHMGKRIDRCFLWGTQCDAPAAAAFCKSLGFSKAIAFEIAEDIGATSPTLVLGDGRICSYPGCDGFSTITCGK